MSNGKKTAVLLLAFGGADCMENVEPFITNVLKPRPVSPELLKSIKDRYTLIGGSSPLLKITTEVARDLQYSLLNALGERMKVYVGMRHWHPFIKETIEEMKADGVERVITFIMTPYATEASAGGYKTDVEAALKEIDGAPEIEFVDPWNTHIRYLEAVFQTINSAQMPFQGILDKGKITMIFSVHSLPLDRLEGDPYLDMINETIELITGRLTVFDDKLAFQSKGGGAGEWIGPSVEEVIEDAGARGQEGILIIPIGFVSDHVETLYDIDILFKEKTEALGMVFSRANSLNATDKFIATLTETTLEKLK